MAKTVLITGCSSGFGKAAVPLFRQAGWNVVATMRDPAQSNATDASEELQILPMEIRDTASIEAAFAQAIERFGIVDCVVNNAGSGLFSVFEATPMKAVRELFETNVFGLMQVTQAALPHFQKNGGGRFVNVSSGAGFVPEPLMSIYSATKFAIEGFTEAVRYELETQNIVVKLVEPGMVAGTNFIKGTLKQSEPFPVPPSYKAVADQTTAMFMSASPFKLATETEVAAAIVAAASEDSDKLRSVVGVDNETSAHMRRETSEAEYSAWARSRRAAKG